MTRVMKGQTILQPHVGMPCVSVVAGGWSVSQVPPELVPGYIIGVNESALLLQRAVHELVTMDRLWTEGRWDQICARQMLSWVRRSALQNKDWRGRPWLNMFDCDNKSVAFHTEEGYDRYEMATDMSERSGVLNGTNSGVCALNRAYQILLKLPLEDRTLYLFGFDMQKGPKGEAHWHAPYPWAVQGATSSGKFAEWARQYSLISDQFSKINARVVNVNNRSKIKEFEVVWLDELRGRIAA